MFQIISGTSQTVSGTQNLERNVPNTAHENVPTNSVLLKKNIVPTSDPCVNSYKELYSSLFVVTMIVVEELLLCSYSEDLEVFCFSG